MFAHSIIALTALTSMTIITSIVLKKKTLGISAISVLITTIFLAIASNKFNAPNVKLTTQEHLTILQKKVTLLEKEKKELEEKHSKHHKPDPNQAIIGESIQHNFRLSLAKNKALNFSDKKFGASFKASELWSTYDLKQETDTHPSYGATLGNDSFLFYCLSLPNSYANRDIINSYISLFGFNSFVETEFKIKSKKIGNHNVEYLTINYEVDGQKLISTLEIVRNKNRIAVFRNWGWANQKLVKSDQIWNTFKWEKQQNDISTLNKEQTLAHTTVKTNSAQVINQIGILYCSKNKFSKALLEFKQAAKIDPHTDDYVNNIIEAYLSMGKTQDALKIAEQSLKKTKKPSQSLLKKYALTLHTLGKIKKAQSVYEQFFKISEQDDDAMYDYLSLLSDNQKNNEALKVAKTYYQNYPSIKTQRWLAYIYLSNSMHNESAATFKEILNNQPNDESSIIGIIDVYIDKKNYSEALKYANSWTSKSPQNINAKIKKIDVLMLSKNKKSAFDYAQKINIEHPNNNNIKIRIAQLSSTLGLGDHSLITTNISPVSLLPELKKNIEPNQPLETSAESNNSTCIYQIHSLNIAKNGEIKETTRCKFKILTPTGVEQHTKYTINLSPTSQNIYINSLKVYNADNVLTHTGNVQDYYITDQDKNMATHHKTIHIPIKTIAVGSTYEFVYTIKTRKYNDIMQFTDYWFINTAHINTMAVSLTGDLSHITFKSTLHIPKIKNTTNTKIWLKKNIAKFKNEQFSPNYAESYPRLAIGSNSLSWKDVSKQYHNHILDKLTTSIEIKKLVSKIIPNDVEPSKKIKKLLQWIQTNITYQAIEFGPRGRMPKAAATTIKTREGDCKDMSLLLCQMLNHAGIEAHMALAHTYEKVIKTIPSEDQFNHLVVFCPSLNNKVIDPTHSHLNIFKFTPYNLNHNHILPVTKNGSTLYQIPDNDGPSIAIKTDKKITTSHKKIHINETVELSGFSASYYRQQLKGKNKNELIQYFTYLFSNYYKHIEIKEVNIIDGLIDNYKPLKLSIQSDYPKNNKNTEIPMLWETIYFQVTRIIDRKNPLSNRHKAYIESTIKLPKQSKFILNSKDTSTKFTQLKLSTTDSQIKIFATRNKCSGTIKEFNTFRQESNKLIPKILIP